MYAVELRARAEKDIASLPASTQRRVPVAIAALGENPRPAGIRKLQAVDAYRVRVGDYRILLEIDDATQRVTIVRVRHRRESYRKS